MYYSKERFLDQQDLVSLTDKIVAPGTTLKFLDIIENTIEENGVEQFNDYIICADSTGKKYKLSIRSYLRMISTDYMYIPDGGSAYELPQSITILNSTDDLLNGCKQYKERCYKRYVEFLQCDIDYPELIDGGLSDNHNTDPKQIYTISTKF